ncbi:hypothetical protein, partial [Delftia sp.]|uniref:hypothetical protein n=1 Tax=Delftia sp. TaxID=1886637 RepID=UPI00259CCA9E
MNSRFESKMLKAGAVWTDAELQTMFGATPNQIALYREARAAIDRSIDMTVHGRTPCARWATSTLACVTWC